MLQVDIALPDIDELQRLVADGQDKGFLTYDEIVTGLEEVELTKPREAVTEAGASRSATAATGSSTARTSGGSASAASSSRS